MHSTKINKGMSNDDMKELYALFKQVASQNQNVQGGCKVYIYSIFALVKHKDIFELLSKCTSEMDCFQLVTSDTKPTLPRKELLMEIKCCL